MINHHHLKIGNFIMNIIRAILFILLPFFSFAEGNKISVRMLSTENGVKIFFEGDNPVFFYNISANMLDVNFQKPVDFQIENLDLKARKHINELNSSDDKKSLIFSLKDANYNITKIDNGSIKGLELIRTKALPTLPPAPVKIENNIDIGSIIAVKKSEEVFTLSFPWREKDIGAAVFHRDGVMWIVFSKAKAFKNMGLINSNLNKNITKLDIIDNSNFTIIRIIHNGNFYSKTKKGDQIWNIEVSSDPATKKNYVPVRTIVQYSSSTERVIFYPASSLKKTFLKLFDPEIGDNMYVICMSDDDYGVDVPKSTIDYSIFRSSEGFAGTLKSDNIEITVINTGVEFKAIHKKLDVSTTIVSPVKGDVIEEKKGENKAIEMPLIPESIINFPRFEDSDFNKIRKKLFTATVGLGDKTKAYFDLGKFYFSNKMYYEAVAAFNMIKIDNLEDEKAKAVILLNLGIAEFMINHLIEAKKHFDDVDKNQLDKKYWPEIDFWQNLMKILLNGADLPINFPKSYNGFLGKYQEDIVFKVCTIDIENSLIVNTEAEHLNKMVAYCQMNAGSDKENNNTVQFYKGVAAKASGNNELALKIWDELYKNTADLKNSTRARAEQVELLYALEKINVTDAIEDLNEVKFRWRGDIIESKVLKDLGEYYKIAGDHINALRVWKTLLGNEGNNRSDNLFIAAEMSSTFVNMFKDKEYLNNLDKFSRMSFIYEFKELIPIGKMGDEIMFYFAKLLIDLDLLDRASSILKHQIDYRFKGEQREEAINLLIYTYLSNRQPIDAVNLIDSSSKEKSIYVSDDLSVARLHFKAQALVDMQKYDDALELLKSDFTNEANVIKGEIFLALKKWNELSDVLLMIMDRREDSKEQLNSKEIDIINAIAVSLYIQKDLDGIRDLRKRFEPLLPEKSPSKDLFAFLLNDKKYQDYRDLIQNMDTSLENIFINTYKDTLKIPQSVN